MLYEGWPAPNLAHRAVAPEAIARLETLLARGEPEKMLETFYRDIAMMSATIGVTMKLSVNPWPAK